MNGCRYLLPNLYTTFLPYSIQCLCMFQHPIYIPLSCLRRHSNGAWWETPTSCWVLWDDWWWTTGGVPTILDAQGRCLGGRGHNLEGFSQQAITEVAEAYMLLPVQTHVYSTVPQLFLNGTTLVNYPTLSYMYIKIYSIRESHLWISWPTICALKLLRVWSIF